MRSNFFPFEVAAAAVLLPGFMVTPAIAADPSICGSVKPAEKDRIVTLAGQFGGTRQIVDQLLVRDM